MSDQKLHLTDHGVASRLKVTGAISRARSLRRAMTKAERLLWNRLRADDLPDLHFRRQAPIGPYFPDFVSHTAKLIVEVDGAIHARDDVALRDIDREEFLRGRGYRILRFSNCEIEADAGRVARLIAQGAADTPTPGPSPQGGGEGR